jgi:gluconate kinase
VHKVYFVAGASGSGKTAIVENLKDLLGESVAIYDFDDIGVPADADKKWRQQATEKWLQKIVAQKRDVCLMGQMVLGEIVACPSARALGKISFCFFDVGDFERVQRLKKRGGYSVDQNMLNWASWLRMHHQDPQWEQRVIIEGGWEGLDHSRWQALKEWDQVARVVVCDTTGLSVEQVAQGVAEIVSRK